jgi:hypothetical protein
VSSGLRIASLCATILLGLLAQDARAQDARAQGRREPPAVVFEFVSASLATGTGVEAPPGTKQIPLQLNGVVRIAGQDARRSAFRLSLLVPVEGRMAPKVIPILPTRWARYAPSDPTLIAWTARWKGPVTPEGCTVRIQSLRSRPRRTVSGPIRHDLRSAAPTDPPSEPKAQHP